MPCDTAGSVGRLVAPATEPLSPVMTGRSLSVRFDTLVRPLDDLRMAAKAADGKLNDAFVAGVAGGLRRYHEQHGAPVDALRMTMPINVRTDGDRGRGGQPVRAGPLPGADRRSTTRSSAWRPSASSWRTSAASRPSASPSRSPGC